MHYSFKFHFFEDKWQKTFEQLLSSWTSYLWSACSSFFFFLPILLGCLSFLKNWFVKILTIIYRSIFQRIFFLERNLISYFSFIVLFICWDAVRKGRRFTHIPCRFLWKDCKQEDKSVYLEGCLCNIISEPFFILKTLRK